MHPSSEDRLKDIVEECQYIQSSAEGLTYESFLSDPDKKRGFVRATTVIGEAAKHVSDAHMEAIPEVPWKQIRGMRNRLVLDYGDVIYPMVWRVAITAIPKLADEIRSFFAQPEKHQ